MLLFTAMCLLLISFVLHILWWRIKVPYRSTMALLFCFSMVLFLFLIYLFLSSSVFPYQLPDLLKLILLYTSCAFVYIIVYSAVEDQSPTLAITYFLYEQNRLGGCNDESLNNLLRADESIKRRICSMEKSGFIQKQNDHWFLTKKGKFIASIFDFSAKFFGLQRLGG